jgi:hypothetical protein
VVDVVDVGHRREHVDRVVLPGERHGRAALVEDVHHHVAQVPPVGRHNVKNGDVVAAIDELVDDVRADEA